ncbi:uncharacterized protein N7459_009138 [Penicillium hispanicum]|uniref:uncharacterized protein n=1 Tax=Penicillium hispanicum TaxID=1080232 RepID=UPI0025413D1B|nr:uncharacterized protein N7459_009138 [Penicillium hispanicum]KAJ5569708.1 hypothetical protein N7459_009138 [Penicillium hispanicum]
MSRFRIAALAGPRGRKGRALRGLFGRTGPGLKANGDAHGVDVTVLHFSSHVRHRRTMIDPDDHISDLRSHLPMIEAMEVADRGEKEAMCLLEVHMKQRGMQIPFSEWRPDFRDLKLERRWELAANAAKVGSTPKSGEERDEGWFIPRQ